MRNTPAQRVDELFREAVTRPRDQQSTFLADACGDDSNVRAEVEELLKHDEQAPPSFLAPPLPRQSAPKLAGNVQEPDPLIGTNVGGCHITARIASGGMGTVYEAVQQQPQRKVAVKMLSPHVVSSSGLRRFQLESQILAHLHHPNIAQVHEAGTHHGDSATPSPGIPYFVMEYVPDAEPITDYTRRRAFSVRHRLELFTKVCDAIHHGHQNGVIHRDLKPGNILVDADGEPKIIDFGVARSTDVDVAVTTMRTDVGQLIGTLQYMSPEQCAGDPHGIDTRSDVFSLGVVLYELLCDRPPFDVSSMSIVEATRIIREQTPERPSTIKRSLRGDAETIALKAMEKVREKRYQSTAELANDIRRYLNREPIEARPPTRLTRIFYWSARRPEVTTTGVCVFIAAMILGGTFLATSWLALHPWRIELFNNDTEARLLARNGREIKVWQSDDGLSRSITMAKMVNQPRAMRDRRLAILGFAGARGATAFPNSLCAYDVDNDLDNPLWERHLEDADIPDFLREERDYIGASFGVALCKMADVLPGSQFPGDEIIAIHKHESTTHSAVRVYDTSGARLYEVWVDAHVVSAYWMSDARELVLAGRNGSALWAQRGHTEVHDTHPTVIFAIRPTPGVVTREYLSEAPGEDPLSPVWYNCLLPPTMSDVFEINYLCLHRPGEEFDSGRTALFGVHALERLGANPAGMTWVLDEFGNVIPESQTMNDTYRLHQSKLPKLSDFYLGELPPIVSTQGGEAEPPLAEGGDE